MWGPLGANNWTLFLPQIVISRHVGQDAHVRQPQAPHAPLCTAHATDHRLAYAFMQGSHRRQQRTWLCQALLIILCGVSPRCILAQQFNATLYDFIGLGSGTASN